MVAFDPHTPGPSPLTWFTMDELAEITQYLLRFAPDALIVVDERGIVRFANETVTQLFGYPTEQLIGAPLDLLVPERFRGRHGQHLGGYMRHPSNREMGARISELYARRADGTEFPAGIRLAPFKLGARTFVAAAIRDATERQQASAALVQAREEADRANRAKSRFLATASHDLRQPLQTIRLLNASLLRIVPQPDARKLLQHQEQAIDSMTRLLNALLDISRLESGAIEPRVTPVPLEETFRELRNEFGEVARARGLLLEIQPAPFVIATDRILFYQLLQNLVGNALKYTDRGRVEITCEAKSDTIAVTVRDTGIGIPGDKLERIFDEYYQVDTLGTKRMGVGLGLAIVKEVARLLGFTVRITSQVGEGTRATVGIPCSQLATSDIAAAEQAGAALGQPTHRRTRLILVEDNDSVRTATELFLKLEGYEVLSAASVPEAERLFAQLRPGDVIIADYHLDSTHTGLEMLLNLRERVQHAVPGIIMSGDLPTVLRTITTPIPDCRFLSKPVDTQALVESIAALGGGESTERRASLA